MSNYDTIQVNGVESTSESRCLICGEQGFERYKLVLRQPLRGSTAGRIVETGSVCEQCAPELRANARTESER